MEHLFFCIGLSLILMHEMDAIRCKEWRILPLLSWLDDKWGFQVFMFAHVPLFCLLFVGLLQKNTNVSLIFGLNIFFMIHFVLHLLFLLHKKNEFKDWISWSIITGCALSGALDLILS